MRLIDADDLRQVLEVFSEKDSLGHTPVQLCDAMPTIDAVEVKHGEWIMYPISDGMNQCSKCGVLRFGESNYCPNCGARMDGEVKNDGK